MGTEGENGGYKYKAFINGEWHDLTLSDSPNELIEWLQSNEEWTRVKHGHWIAHGKSIIGIPIEAIDKTRALLKKRREEAKDGKI